MKQLLPSLIAFLAGVLFCLGLGVAGMTEPAKVIAFLDIFGAWDPSLIFVMAGGIIVHSIMYRWIIKRKTPLFDMNFSVPSNKKLDRKLFFGAALFGIGWGISGLCPGPGLGSMASGKPYILSFVLSLIIGTIGAITAQRLLSKRKSQP